MTVTISGTSGISGADGSVGTPAFQGTDTNTGIYFPGADTIGLAAGGTQVASIGLGTTLALQGATSQSGSGVTFPATQSASSNANTLDDYEEGTFTPQIYGSTTRGTTTYGTNGQVGRYTKIGNRVYFQIWLQWTNATGTGNLSLDGLPFASGNVTNAYNPITAYVDGGLTLSASNVFQAYIGFNTGNLIFTQYPAGGGSAVSIAMDTAAAIMLSGHYLTD